MTAVRSILLIFLVGLLSCKQEPRTFDLVGSWIVFGDTFSEDATWRTVTFTPDSMYWVGRDYETNTQFNDEYAYTRIDFTFIELNGSGDQAGDMRYVFHGENEVRVFNERGGMSLNRR